MDKNRYISITALTRYIKHKFENDSNLQEVWVRGELSNVKLHSRGHLYFTLKDANSRISAVMFAGNARYLKFKPEEGMKVLIRGEVSIYEPMGQYQLYAREMQPDGIGNLFLAFEELKKKLDKEGLFAPEFKKSIPAFPREIGVITSPTGAAIRDIMTTIKRRYPIARVTIFPVLVQGPNAALSIAKAITQANQLGQWDVLIVGRGGGSIEELWAFNEEVVARSIFQSNVPIISAVGHETDFTIADFVADLRAATPTAAAELAVPHMLEIQERLEQRKFRLIRTMKEQVQYERERLSRLRKSYAFRYPTQLIKQKEQDLDRTFDKLQREIKRNFASKKEELEQLNKLIGVYHPREQFTFSNEKLKQTYKLLVRRYHQQLKEKKHHFRIKTGMLDALSPLKIMERGYSLAYTGDEKLIKSVRHVQPGDQITVQLKDGHLDCQVWGLEESEKYE
jgi:exodeoxyribonuclease VII large subunit